MRNTVSQVWIVGSAADGKRYNDEISLGRSVYAEWVIEEVHVPHGDGWRVRVPY